MNKYKVFFFSEHDGQEWIHGAIEVYAWNHEGAIKLARRLYSSNYTISVKSEIME